eukprot:6211059-Pleurochrysis_carterae.AAC.5
MENARARARCERRASCGEQWWGGNPQEPPPRSKVRVDEAEATRPGQAERRRGDCHGEGADQVDVVVRVHAGPPQLVQVRCVALEKVVVWVRLRAGAAEAHRAGEGGSVSDQKEKSDGRALAAAGGSPLGCCPAAGGGRPP